MIKFSEIQSLISDMQGIPIEKITLEKHLESDLGISGDDGVDLLEAFVDKFQIDIANSKFFLHFHAEGTEITRPLIIFLTFCVIMLLLIATGFSFFIVSILSLLFTVLVCKFIFKYKKEEQIVDLTVGDLLQIAEEGVWIENND